ncbi:hypothetical protein B0H11DRAFT_1199670 [Mycena galericulata]|nr:hypothetical protein B0H11DRAFT_1199670 [Mycena galericulata]
MWGAEVRVHLAHPHFRARFCLGRARRSAGVRYGAAGGAGSPWGRKERSYARSGRMARNASGTARDAAPRGVVGAQKREDACAEVERMGEDCACEEPHPSPDPGSQVYTPPRNAGVRACGPTTAFAQNGALECRYSSLPVDAGSPARGATRIPEHTGCGAAPECERQGGRRRTASTPPPPHLCNPAAMSTVAPKWLEATRGWGARWGKGRRGEGRRRGASSLPSHPPRVSERRLHPDASHSTRARAPWMGRCAELRGSLGSCLSPLQFALRSQFTSFSPPRACKPAGS